MIRRIKNMPYLSELIYVLTLSFRRYKGLYVVYFANIISILIEFLAIAILSMVSQKGVELRFYFLQGISKEVLFIIFIALFLLRFISMLILEGFIVYFAKEMQVYFSSSAFRKVLFENIKDIEKVEIGHYITLSGDEASNASQLLISTSAIINSLLLIAAYLIAVMMFANNILIWLLVLFLLIAVLVKIIYKKLFYLGHKQANLRRSSSSIFMDAFNSLRVIKAFSLEKYMSQKYKEEVDKYFGINSLLEIYGNLTKIIPIILLFLFFEFYLVTNYIYHDIFNITFLVTLLFMMMRLLQSIGTLSGLLGKIAGQLKGVKNLVEFIQKSYISSQKSNLESSIKRLDIENITFAYGENKIFNGLNLSFISGKSYAICGESGSGKSTLLDLMLNFITPQEGKITVNGIDVQHIEENNLTKHILYIGQESLIFNQSIKENIVLQDIFSTIELDIALHSVKLDDMVQELEDGVEHILYYKGTNLSGGQRQRINLARALIRKPDVLILDESTSALDELTKKYIINNLLQQYKDKIVILVTHDLSLLPLVSEVINLKELKND